MHGRAHSAVVRGNKVRDKIGQARVAERAKLEAQVLAQVIGVDDVEAEFDGVLAFAPGDRVGALRATLVRKSWPLQEGRNAHVEAVTDENVG